MLTEKNVFVRLEKIRRKAHTKQSPAGSDKRSGFEIEVSNLMPEYWCQIKTAYDVSFAEKRSDGNIKGEKAREYGNETKSLHTDGNDTEDESETDDLLDGCKEGEQDGQSTKSNSRSSSLNNNMKHVTPTKGQDDRNIAGILFPAGMKELREILTETVTDNFAGQSEQNEQTILGKNPANFLETLSRVRPPMKVSEELGSFPMAKLAKHQWFVYQGFIIAALLIHTTMMGWYTQQSQTTLRGFKGTLPNNSSMDTGSPDFIMMIYVAVLSCVVLAFYLFSFYLDQKLSNHRNRGDMNKDEWTILEKITEALLQPFKKFVETSSEYTEADGTLLNIITYVIAFIAEHTAIVISLGFAVSSIGLVILSRHLNTFSLESYVWMKGIVIRTGWIIVLILARAYRPIYSFISSLKYIFLRDIIPFLIFYIVLSFAFGCALQLQFQLLKEETAELEEFGSTSTFGNFLTSVPSVVWELFIAIQGMDTNIKHVQNVGYLFQLDGYHSFFVELLLVTHGLVTLIVLMNMLIATMNSTYADVIQRQGRGWRQYQVNQTITIRRLTFERLDGRVKSKAGASQDKKTNRWYLPIMKEDLRDIRAKYWNRSIEGKSEEEKDVQELLDDSSKEESRKERLVRIGQSDSNDEKVVEVSKDRNKVEEDKFEKLFNSLQLIENQISGPDSMLQKMSDDIKSLKDEISHLKTGKQGIHQ